MDYYKAEDWKAVKANKLVIEIWFSMETELKLHWIYLGELLENCLATYYLRKILMLLL